MNMKTGMDKTLKQRLLGTAILVALAVIIVPELVKEPESSERPVLQPETEPLQVC